MRVIFLLFQLQAAPDNYSSVGLKDFVARTAANNRVPPASLHGYKARVETELGFIMRDSLGREVVAQVEQLAADATWKRDSNRYDLHVVGFRALTLGVPYSALTFTRMYTVPTLYGQRLVIGMNDGLPRRAVDTASLRRALARDSAAGRQRFRSVHPLADDRDRYYRFTGGDTVATLYVRDRAIRIVRVNVEPIDRPDANFNAFRGEIDIDADKHQLVRMRGRLQYVGNEKPPLAARATGAVGVAYLEFENAEIDGEYWLPAFQRSEFQAGMGLLGDARPIYRIVSRFREYDVVRDSSVTLAMMDTLPRIRASMAFAARDSISRFGDWRENLGVATNNVGGGDFDDIAPDVWRPTGSPRVSFWPRRLEEVIRFNRVEGLYTGAAARVNFRDRAPGLSAQVSLGWAWAEETVRGSASVAQQRGSWRYGARAERMLAVTNDFLSAQSTGASLGPLLGGTDDHDYVDRWIGGVSVTRFIRDVDRAVLSGELAAVSDRPRERNVEKGIFGGESFLPNRVAARGDYGRLVFDAEVHPRVTGETLAPGTGGRLHVEAARGGLAYDRVELRLATRRYWRGLVLASRLDAGVVSGNDVPPQQLFELGGVYDLPSYGYKEFGGDRAALGRALIAYHFPVLRAPVRVFSIFLPGLSPGIGAGIQGGWTEASSDAIRAKLAALGSSPTRHIRATADVRLTFLSGAFGVGMSRPIDGAGAWKPYFAWGAAF